MAEGRIYMTINEWKDLDIRDIPSDFFVNERYEIQFMGKEWVTEKDYDELEERDQILEGLRENVKYRYRLKPLEPIRISQNELLALSNYFFNKDMTKEDFEKAYCRPVENNRGVDYGRVERVKKI